MAGAAETSPSKVAPSEPEEERNEGRGRSDYDEKHPNPNDIHSDDPLVAGLANGQRQAEGKGDEGGPVR